MDQNETHCPSPNKKLPRWSSVLILIICFAIFLGWLLKADAKRQKFNYYSDLAGSLPKDPEFNNNAKDLAKRMVETADSFINYYCVYNFIINRRLPDMEKERALIIYQMKTIAEKENNNIEYFKIMFEIGKATNDQNLKNWAVAGIDPMIK